MNMRKKPAVIITILSLILFPVCSLSQETNPSGSDKIYENTLDHIISCCSSKCELADSRLAKIREAAERAGRKGEFCKIHRQRLLKEMKQVNLPQKPYKIEYFVNSKFLEFEKNRDAVGNAE